MRFCGRVRYRVYEFACVLGMWRYILCVNAFYGRGGMFVYVRFGGCSGICVYESVCVMLVCVCVCLNMCVCSEGVAVFLSVRVRVRVCLSILMSVCRYTCRCGCIF